MCWLLVELAPFSKSVKTTAVFRAPIVLIPIESNARSLVIPEIIFGYSTRTASGTALCLYSNRRYWEECNSYSWYRSAMGFPGGNVYDVVDTDRSFRGLCRAGNI